MKPWFVFSGVIVLTVIGFTWSQPRQSGTLAVPMSVNPEDSAPFKVELPIVEFEAPEFVIQPSWGNSKGVCDGCAENSCAPQPAVPAYPTTDLRGVCEVEFFLNDHGVPFDIFEKCSNDVFVKSAERAIAEMRWPTTDLNGDPCRRIGKSDFPIRYPIEYRLQ